MYNEASLASSCLFPAPDLLLAMEVGELTRITVPPPVVMGNQKRVTITNFEAILRALATTGPKLSAFLQNEMGWKCRIDGQNRLDVCPRMRNETAAIRLFAHRNLLCLLCNSPARFYYTDQRLLMCGGCRPQRIP